MRVLLVSGHFQPAWEWGGVVSATWELSRALVQAGVQVTVLTTDGGMQPRAEPIPTEREEQGVRIVTCPVVGGHRWSVANRMAISATSLLRAVPLVREADLVHINGVWSPHVAQVWAMTRCMRRPYIVSPHGNLERYSLGQSQLRKRLFMALYSRRILTGAAAIHFTVQNEQHEAPGWLQSRPAVIVPCVVKSLARGDGARFRQRFSLGAEQRVLGMVGRIHHKKGFDIMLPALARAETSPAARLVVVGPEEGDYLSEVKQMIRELALGDRVLFSGELHDQDLADAYAGFDLLMLPSYEENFGLVVAEAMMQGTPVAISEFVGSKDWVLEAGGGVVLPRELGSWVALLQSLEQPGLLDGWCSGDLARRTRDNFSLESVGQAMVQGYREIIGIPPIDSAHIQEFPNNPGWFRSR